MRRHCGWLAIGLLALLWSAGCGGGGEADGERLLVIDQNILHGILDEDLDAQPYDRLPERIELIARALAAARPDIVVLQEVFLGGEDYPDVRGILLAALGEEYRAVFGDIAGGAINTGVIGQMTLTRLPVLSAENRFVGGVRSVHRVTVETERGPLDVYNAHLEGTEPDPQAAIDEIEEVLAFIRETRSGEGPVILAGDFNAEPDDPAIRAVLDAGFIDALVAGGDATCARAGDPGCTSSTLPLADNPANRTRRRIDYVFILPGEEFSFGVERAEPFLDAPEPVGAGRLLWPSDHIGVQALLELARR